MKIFLNPIGISDEYLSMIFFFKTTVIVIVAFILLGLTMHIYKKQKNDTDGSEENKSKKNLALVIMVDVLVLASVVGFLVFID